MRGRLADAAWTAASLPIYLTAVTFIKAADWWLTRQSRRTHA